MIHQFSINFQLLGQTPTKLDSELPENISAFSELTTIISALDQSVETYSVVVQVVNGGSLSDHIKAVKRIECLMKSLSGREMEVFVLAIKGLSNKEISEELFISVETVRTHRKKIVNKAGVKKIEEIKNWLLTLNL